MELQESSSSASETAAEMSLYPSRRKWMLKSVLCAGATLVCIPLVSRIPVVAWTGLAFFGVATLVSSTRVLFPQMWSLRLTSTGFRLRTLLQTRVILWSDVSYFSVANHSKNVMVVFSYRPSYQGPRLSRPFVFNVADWDGALPDTYGMSAQELAELMNAWKRRSNASRSAEQAES